MERKDLEKKIQESANEIKLRDFSLVWNEIKEDVEGSVNKRKKHKFFWMPMLASITTAFLIFIVGIPIALYQINKNAPKVYFIDQLNTERVTEQEFYNDLKTANIKHINFDQYIIPLYQLVKTVEGETKGGVIEAYDDENNATFFLNVQFFDSSVKINEELYSDYTTECFINNLLVRYKLKEQYPADNLYVYGIKATYQSVNYLIEYTCFSSDVETFLNSLFR